jgi:hypothetical protein
MPDLETLLTASLLAGLVITAAFVIAFSDWRLALFALAAQYVLAAILVLDLLPYPLPLVRVISGTLALVIFWITFRQRSSAYRRAMAQAPDDAALAAADRRYHPGIFVAGFLFRLLALTLVAMGILGISSSMSFLGLPADILFGALWLISAGILVAIVSRDVLWLGLGILMLTSGFTILETAMEASLLLFGLLNISDLLLAVVVAHLSALPVFGVGPRRRRGEIE